MKRSEVLQRLATLLDTTENITAPNSSYYDADELAEEILQFIEKIGMYPCKVESLPGIGDLMTPKGWEEE